MQYAKTASEARIIQQLNFQSFELKTPSSRHK